MVFPDPLASHDDPQLQILMGRGGRVLTRGHRRAFPSPLCQSFHCRLFLRKLFEFPPPQSLDRVDITGYTDFSLCVTGFLCHWYTGQESKEE